MSSGMAMVVSCGTVVASATSLGRSCCQTCAALVSGGKPLPPGNPQTSQPQRLHKRRTRKEREAGQEGQEKMVLGGVKGSSINLLWAFCSCCEEFEG